MKTFSKYSNLEIRRVCTQLSQCTSLNHVETLTHRVQLETVKDTFLQSSRCEEAEVCLVQTEPEESWTEVGCDFCCSNSQMLVWLYCWHEVLLGPNLSFSFFMAIKWSVLWLWYSYSRSHLAFNAQPNGQKSVFCLFFDRNKSTMKTRLVI